MTGQDPFVLSVHPAAAVFPMLADDELAELAEDIAATGLREPLVVQQINGKALLIDGRNRRAACKLAGLVPEIRWLPPEQDAVELIYSANITRRHLSKGQRAMAVAKLYPNPAKGGRGRNSFLKKEFSDVSISKARTVLAHAPDLADTVLSGAIPLNEAYQEALGRKKEKDSDEAQFSRLQKLDPDLANLVVEERLRLKEAVTTLDKRLKEEEETEKNFRLTVFDSFSMLVSGSNGMGSKESIGDRVAILRDPRWESERKQWPLIDKFAPAMIERSIACLKNLLEVMKNEP